MSFFVLMNVSNEKKKEKIKHTQSKNVSKFKNVSKLENISKTEILSKSEKIQKIISILGKEYPDIKCPLYHRNTLELLIAVMLSAQCTDERVNLVTPALFNRFKSVEEYANADILEIEKYIRSTGFYHNKSKNIQEACRKIVETFHSKVPDTMEELLLLRGVARKTANVVLSTAFKKQVGIVVDTHVTRLTNLIGLVKTENAVVIERELMPFVPADKRNNFSLLLIWHGRKICIANRPKCDACKIRLYCEYGMKKG